MVNKKDAMNDYGGGIPSADRIAAAFPHTILESINGTPSRTDIDGAQEKQTENAASQPSTRGGGAHGHAGMVLPPAQYVVDFSPTAYTWEPIPDEAPVYHIGITATAQRLLNNNFSRAMRIYRDQSGTHTALKNQLHQTYSPEYWPGVVHKQTENAASQPSTRGGGSHGHTGMVVTPERYVVEFFPTSYVWEPIPDEAPVYPVGITATAQRL